MWTSRKKQPPIRSLIGEGTVIHGELHFDAGLRVDGEVMGDVVATDPASLLVISENARVQGIITTDVEPEQSLVGTSGDEAMPMVQAGQVRFELGGAAYVLTMYWIDVYGGGLFLPFRDQTAPLETYGGGRYLVDTVKGSDFQQFSREGSAAHVTLDFNYAYNPSCAYNYRWSCPLAPPENRLPVAVRAGERKPG